MRSVTVKLAVALLLTATMAACVPSEGMIEAGLAKPPEPELVEGAYLAKSDAKFPIAALPEEQIPEQFRRQTVYYPTDEVPGTIVIDPSKRLLYFVTDKNQAIRYGIAVGADGFGWSGVSDVTNKRHWPTWTPPREMIERKPSLAKWEKGQPGGPTNPLGARAIYLTTNGRDYGYRIHGTPEWKSIGRNASSGCFRMINQDVMDLYERVPMGAKVVVLTADGSYPTKLTVPPPAPVKKKPAETPVVTPAAVVVPAPTTMPSATIPGLTTVPEATPAPAATVVTPVEPAAPLVTAPAEPVAPAAVVPAAPAPVEPAPAAAPAPVAPATEAPACSVPLVNGTCPTP